MTAALLRFKSKLPAGTAQFVRYGANCGAVLASKLLLMWLLSKLLQAFAAYFIVHCLTFFISYTLHSWGTFGVALSLQGMRDYFATVIGFKLLDYAIFSVAFAYFGIEELAAVVAATAIVMVLRFIVVRRVLTGSGRAPIVERC